MSAASPASSTGSNSIVAADDYDIDNLSYEAESSFKPAPKPRPPLIKMCERPASATGGNTTVAAARKDTFSDEAESSFAPAPKPKPKPKPLTPNGPWCFRRLVDALHGAVNEIRADHGLPPVVSYARGRSRCARCWCDLEVPDVEYSISKEGWIMVCSEKCLRPRDYAGKEERWQGWQPWN